MENVNTEDKLNLEEKVTVHNIAGWKIGFHRIDGVGDIAITPEGSTRLSRNEIISQVQNGNPLFTGIDGTGNHATLFIDDSSTRNEVGFENQIIFNDEKAGKIFALKSQAAFEKEIKDYIKTRAEKYAVMKAIKRLGINNYTKIRFIEDYTGYKLM